MLLEVHLASARALRTCVPAKTALTIGRPCPVQGLIIATTVVLNNELGTTYYAVINAPGPALTDESEPSKCYALPDIEVNPAWLAHSGPLGPFSGRATPRPPDSFTQPNSPNLRSARHRPA